MAAIAAVALVLGLAFQVWGWGRAWLARHVRSTSLATSAEWAEKAVEEERRAREFSQAYLVAMTEGDTATGLLLGLASAACQRRAALAGEWSLYWRAASEIGPDDTRRALAKRFPRSIFARAQSGQYNRDGRFVHTVEAALGNLARSRVRASAAPMK